MEQYNIEEVRQKLKEEFFGIDEQIDNVIKTFETWLSVKEYQTRPMTVCLWGLTGTGKTALINRTIELLDLNKKKFYIKFGSKTSRIDDDFEQNTCEDTIFVLDEFQYFKTKRENGDEIERDEDNSTNMIWELLDGGIINLYGQGMTYSYEKIQLTSTIYVLKELDAFGVKLKNGIISHPQLNQKLKQLFVPLDSISTVESEKNADNFDKKRLSSIANYYDDDDDDDDDDDNDDDNKLNQSRKNVANSKNKYDLSLTEITLKSLTQINWSTLYDFVKTKDVDYNFMSKPEMYDFMKKLNDISELTKFFRLIKDSKQKLDNRNYTKSLIFVLGNLDECFSMSTNLNSDLDADFFYKKTKNVTIIDIRKALLKRFRPEQIARLGSTHIIYPSLNRDAFERIINKELIAFGNTTKQKFPNIIDSVTYSDNIKELIYKEGVFPVVGARSVFSIVNEIISDKFPTIIKTVLSIKESNLISIRFDYNKRNNLISVKFIDIEKNKEIESKEFKYIVKVDKLRVEKNKGKQTHRAVHEAGHAICSIFLNKSFPEVIYSVVLDDKTGGFNLLNTEDHYYYTKSNFINEVSTLLAGYVAEKIVFGEENISNGSGSDINKATSLIMTLMKEAGFMGDEMIGQYMSKSFTSTMFETTQYSLIDSEDIISKKAEELLCVAIKNAEEILLKENKLFYKVSEYLSKNPKMTNKKLKEYTKKYILHENYSDLFKDKYYFYSEMLNDKLKEYE